MEMHPESEKAAPISKLLTQKEQTICKQITSHTPPYSQRALALLALDEGVTQAQAAEQTGLSIGQVRYWLAKFRKQRLSIFPDTMLGELKAAEEETELEPAAKIEAEAISSVEELDLAKDKTKGAKERKGKEAGKTKKIIGKAIKDKKDKKTKKVKQKTKKRKKAKTTMKDKKESKNKKGKKEGEVKKGKKGKKEKKSKK